MFEKNRWSIVNKDLNENEEKIYNYVETNAATVNRYYVLLNEKVCKGLRQQKIKRKEKEESRASQSNKRRVKYAIMVYSLKDWGIT